MNKNDLKPISTNKRTVFERDRGSSNASIDHLIS